jgi:hypothetical protein
MRFNTVTGLGLATLSVVVAVPINNDMNDVQVNFIFSYR